MLFRSEPKIVRKVLRSLLERFYAKITAIEESKDIDKIPLIELVGTSVGLAQPISTACYTFSSKDCKKSLMRTFQYA